MSTYIALLRGINVGGHRTIKMADLRVLLNNLHFANVTTYIQSGNIVFSTEVSSASCEKVLKEAIKKKFNLDVPILVLEINDLKEILNECPFSKLKQQDSYYTILSKLPESDKALNFESIVYLD